MSEDMKPIVTWVLVADLASARILEHSDDREGLVQQADSSYNAIETLPYSDDEGRTMAGTTSARVRMDRHIEYTPEAEAFARTLIDALIMGKRDKAYDHLLVCAGPSMLGLLRTLITKDISNVVRAEVAKDLVNMPNEKIFLNLKPLL